MLQDARTVGGGLSRQHAQTGPDADALCRRYCLYRLALCSRAVRHVWHWCGACPEKRLGYRKALLKSFSMRWKRTKFAPMRAIRPGRWTEKFFRLTRHVAES
ncbi:hypothetical protein X805_06300 [Sphaerotilus natans subsp. natans DSM 6575]|uniref:Uncharacterized protein n=1 Tax=Sphaerotilus natans subsp. natans DSM 6575 TaxID=1286631 RepID=A0A059KQQ9_9BURK|nr:hypothetical protein X805_06300 [Sphaerotilus natans subsp. natans DSM 6575]